MGSGISLDRVFVALSQGRVTRRLHFCFQSLWLLLVTGDITRVNYSSYKDLETSWSGRLLTGAWDFQFL